MAESFELPSRLAILPFRNKVLLPGAIIRIRCTSPRSVRLVEQELWQREEKGLIGVLPVRDAADTASVAPMDPTGSGDGGTKTPVAATDSLKLDGKSQQDLIQWHTRGVVARALHHSRGVEKPSGRVTYIVVLEGLCRFSVQELSVRGTYHTARVSRLDMTKTEMEQAEQDPEIVALSRQFKATAMELISVLEQKQETVGRTKVLLETVPVLRLVDIFVANFEISFEEQLSMLDSVDVKVRLVKAIGLVDRHLQRVAVNNPVMPLDEIDKTGSDVRGDPASALLEVLAPEQNKRFNDHYLNVSIDLSKIIFVATANKIQPIPLPFLDCMEVIELPRVLDQHGLSSDNLQIPELSVSKDVHSMARLADATKEDQEFRTGTTIAAIVHNDIIILAADGRTTGAVSREIKSEYAKKIQRIGDTLVCARAGDDHHSQLVADYLKSKVKKEKTRKRSMTVADFGKAAHKYANKNFREADDFIVIIAGFCDFDDSLPASVVWVGSNIYHKVGDATGDELYDKLQHYDKICSFSGTREATAASLKYLTEGLSRMLSQPFDKGKWIGDGKTLVEEAIVEASMYGEHTGGWIKVCVVLKTRKKNIRFYKQKLVSNIVAQSQAESSIREQPKKRKRKKN